MGCLEIICLQYRVGPWNCVVKIAYSGVWAHESVIGKAPIILRGLMDLSSNNLPTVLCGPMMLPRKR
jgi:hypothetical protein